MMSFELNLVIIEPFRAIICLRHVRTNTTRKIRISDLYTNVDG
jgi:hypothetical protein